MSWTEGQTKAGQQAFASVAAATTTAATAAATATTATSATRAAAAGLIIKNGQQQTHLLIKLGFSKKTFFSFGLQKYRVPRFLAAN